jgi:hypothetical protein
MLQRSNEFQLQIDYHRVICAQEKSSLLTTSLKTSPDSNACTQPLKSLYRCWSAIKSGIKPLLGLGCPKQAFAKIATPRVVIIRMKKIPYIDQSGMYAIEDAVMALQEKKVLVSFPCSSVATSFNYK